MKIMPHELPKPSAIAAPNAMTKRQNAKPVINNVDYRNDLRSELPAKDIALKWGVAHITVRQHRCNLRKRGML